MILMPFFGGELTRLFFRGYSFTLRETWSYSMPNITKRSLLTPEQAAEKEQILNQIRINPRGPWINGKKLTMPKAKRTKSATKKK
jgi:hypothetical protein